MVTSNFPFALLTYRVELQTKWPVAYLKTVFFEKLLKYINKYKKL